MPNWGQGAQGAAGGAMTGAAVGSAFGPYGAAIGAVGGGLIGGAVGLFGSSGGQKYDEVLRQRLLQLEKQYGQPTTASQASYSDFRKNQAALIAQQEAMSRGEGPSAAAILMREAMDRTTASQASLAAGAIGHGVNAGAALRGAANNAAALQAQGAHTTALARVNEQMAANQLLGGNLSNARAADEAVNMFNAEAQNRENAARRQAQLQALAQAGGTAYGTTPGTGSSILAGGASAYPAIMQANGSTQNQPTQGPVQPVAPVQADPRLQTSAWNPGGSSDYAISLPWNPKP